MNHLIIYTHSWVAFDLFCPFLSGTLLGRGSRLTNARVTTAEKCRGQGCAAWDGGMYQVCGCGQSFLGWWLDLMILKVSSNLGNSKTTQVLVHQPQKPRQSALFKNRNEPKCYLFPLLYWLRLNLRGRKSKTNGKVQSCYTCLKSEKKQKGAAYSFGYVFRTSLQLHALNETESLGENPAGISLLAVTVCESGPGLFQGGMCFMWPNWGCCLSLHRIE